MRQIAVWLIVSVTILILNLGIGLCTPPVGSILFVGCAIAKTSIGKIVRPMIPMYAAMFLALMVVTYWPGFSEFLLAIGTVAVARRRRVVAQGRRRSG